MFSLFSKESKDCLMVQRTLDRLAIKRIGAPEDIVGTAIFLASPAAGWLTGQILAVDGGWLAA